jgi:uncharacterized protein (TIGR02145 family)
MKKRFIFLILSCLLFIGCDKDKKETVTIEYGSGVDNNGNPFTTVRIGNQWWMAENLHSTLYQNGDTLEYISKEDAATQWNLIPSGAFTFHNDSLFGNLYNFRSIQDARKIAPKGWRVPTDADWIELEKHIGMSTEAANAFGWRGEKEANLLTAKYSKGWPEFSPLYGEDSFGFNAVPGGCITLLNAINNAGNAAFWWTATEDNDDAYYRYIDAQQTRILRSKTSQLYGMSIRCIKE